MYAFQSESTLNSCLNAKELLARGRRNIWSLSDCNGTRTLNHVVHKRTLNHLAKLAFKEIHIKKFPRNSCVVNLTNKLSSNLITLLSRSNMVLFCWLVVKSSFFSTFFLIAVLNIDVNWTNLLFCILVLSLLPLFAVSFEIWTLSSSGQGLFHYTFV